MDNPKLEPIDRIGENETVYATNRKFHVIAPHGDLFCRLNKLTMTPVSINTALHRRLTLCAFCAKGIERID